MLIILWIILVVWFLFEGYETRRDGVISSGFIAWLAVTILTYLALGFPK